MQAHKHWLALMKISAEPSIYNGWKTHHNRMCDDPDLLKWAHAWQSHDKQLCSSFMDCPFIIAHPTHRPHVPLPLTALLHMTSQTRLCPKCLIIPFVTQRAPSASNVACSAIA